MSMPRLAALLLPLAACGDPLADEVLTSGGTWRVSIAEAPALGDEELRLRVEGAADAEPVSDLELLVVASMPGMSHGGSADQAEMEEPGVYAAQVDLGMPGTWAIDGELTDGGVSEEFTLYAEVEG